MSASSLEPLGAYFKANGWPEAKPGELKTIAQMDRNDLCHLARLLTATLQTEFATITQRKPVQREHLTEPLCPISGLPERIFSGPPVQLMQSHSPAVLAGIHVPQPKPPLKLTAPMIFYMKAVITHGSGAWDKGGGRAGGAISRMWDRLVAAGYSTPVPYKITKAGLRALRLEAERLERKLKKK